MRRRAFLVGGTALVGTGLGLGRLGGRGRRATGEREPTDVILADTPHETPVYILEGERPGPTGFVVGGMHGDERSGYLAADRLLKWSLQSGRLVVVPRANQVAIRRNERHGERGDLNRQFPPRQAPVTELARAIWSIVERHDPDVTLNLHSSNGIYGTHPDFVGQAVFPTATGDARTHATQVVEQANERVVPWYMPLHDFQVANVLDGTAPLFTHKVDADLEIPGYIVETAEFLVDPQTGAKWNLSVAEALLVRHGLERVEGR